MPWHSSRNISKQQNLPHKTKGDTKMSKNFEKTIKAQKKTKLSTLWPSGYPLVPHSLWGLVVFFVFSKFFLFLTKRQKPRENKKHTKAPKLSTQWPYGYPLAPHSLWSFFLFLTKSGSCLGHLLVCWRFFSQNSFKILTFTTPPPIATSSLFFGWVGLSYTFRLQFAKGASQQLRRKQPQPWNDSDALRDAALGNYGGNVTRLSEWPSAPSSGQVQVRKIMRRISTG